MPTRRAAGTVGVSLTLHALIAQKAHSLLVSNSRAIFSFLMRPLCYLAETLINSPDLFAPHAQDLQQRNADTLLYVFFSREACMLL